MKVSLIIPTYNRENALVNTIGDCLSQDFKDLEIIVIDQTKQHQTVSGAIS
jgi:glycosyltransferase involved in cell wall biosynthesis